MIRYRNIVVGVDLTAVDRLVAGADDLTPSCRAALFTATWIARKFGASLHLLTTLDVDAHAESLIRADRAAGRRSLTDTALRTLDGLVAAARAEGLVATTQVGFGRPAKALLDEVAKHGRDLVIVGTRSRGAAARNLLGSTALQLVRHAAAAVWIARRGPDEGMDHVVAAVDSGGEAEAAAEAATSLAAEFRAPLHLVHVLDWSAERILRMGGATDADVDDWRRERRSHVDAATTLLAAHAAAAGLKIERHLVDGDPAERIVSASREIGADLVVMCTRTHSALHSVFSGSTVEPVLTTIDTSLLVVRPG